MNNKAAVFGAFIIGTLIGAGSVIVYGKNKYIKKDIYEKEISCAREEQLRMQDGLLKEKKVLEEERKALAEEKKNIAEKNVLYKSRIMDDYQKGLSSFGYVEEVLGKANENLEVKQKEEPKKDIPIPEPVKEAVRDEDYDDDSKIYIIGEEDFGELGYDIRDLTFYDNGVVTDEVGEVIDPNELLGGSMAEILEGYSEGGFKEVYVRNDLLKVDLDVELAGTDFFEG